MKKEKFSSKIQNPLVLDEGVLYTLGKNYDYFSPYECKRDIKKDAILTRKYG